MKLLMITVAALALSACGEYNKLTDDITHYQCTGEEIRRGFDSNGLVKLTSSREMVTIDGFVKKDLSSMAFGGFLPETVKQDSGVVHSQGAYASSDKDSWAMSKNDVWFDSKKQTLHYQSKTIIEYVHKKEHSFAVERSFFGRCHEVKK